MVAEQQFQCCSASLMNLTGFALDYHSGLRRDAAGRHKFPVDFHQAYEAGIQWTTFFQVTKRGNINAEFAGRM
jgi:hypothetical protein